MRTIEQKKPLLQRQLFGMKRETLEAKIISYFEFSNDTSALIKYLVILMVRNSLVVSDYSFVCRELICDVLLTAEPTDVLREYCAYFKDYFKKSGDWDRVVRRLFKNKKNYYRLSEKARSYKKLLDTPGTEAVNNSELALRIISTFEDTSGKKHTLTIADADETRSKADVYKILEILTTVNLFKTADGVRRFARILKAKRPGTKETLKEDEQQVAEVQNVKQEVKQKQNVEILVPVGIDPGTFTDEELLAMIQVEHPEVASLESICVVFTEPALQSEENDALEAPFSAPLIESNRTTTVRDNRIASKSSLAVSDLPAEEAQRPRKRNWLTARAAYIQSLFKNGPQKKKE